MEILKKILIFWEKVPTPLRMSIVAGICAVIFIVYLVSFYFPKSYSIDKKNDEIVQLDSNIQKGIEVANLHAEYSGELLIKKRKFEKALNLLPKETNVPELIRIFYQLANKAKVVMNSFDVGSPGDQGFYSTIPIDVNIKGTYFEIAAFFNLVSRSERIIKVNDFNLTGPKKEFGKTILSSSCKLIAYKFNEEKEVLTQESTEESTEEADSSTSSEGEDEKKSRRRRK
ncbi:MAG: type 4a pilus biogenesis protein PilO [Pseudomonadota bacterium]